MAGQRILVADDDREVLGLLTATLEAGGFQVESASDGAQALTLFQSRPVDLLITDVHMPHLNGVELVHRIRLQGSRLPVIMMSAMATAMTKQRATRLGSLVFIDKPFDPLQIPEIAADMMDPARQKERLRNRRILIADDHAPTLELLRVILTAVGYEVTTATHGQEAIERLKEAVTPFDMAMVDIVMPGVGGPGVVEQLKQVSPATLPILMTGEATSGEIGEGYRKGGYTLIRKPFEIDTLLHFLGEMERQCDQLKSEVVERAEEARAPVAQKTARWMTRLMKAPEGSKEHRAVRTVAMIFACVVIAVMILWAASFVEHAVTGEQSRIGGFLDRVEGYLQRDEDRELRSPPGK